MGQKLEKLWMVTENYPAERRNCAQEETNAGIQSWGVRRG